MKKRFFSALLAAVMIVCTLPNVVSAKTVTDGYLTFNTSTGKITHCDISVSGEFVIPDEINGVAVTGIDYRAFYYCTYLTKIVIPAGITKIGRYVFSGCSGLTGIEVDPDNSFYSSEDGVLFDKDKSELICCPGGKSGVYTIPDTVLKLNAFAFDRCTKLTEIVIPDSLESIDEGAFNLCRNLKDITVDENNQYYCSVDGTLFSKDLTLLMQYAANKSGTSYTIPDDVININDYAFYYCRKLKEITMPNSVESIGIGAFSDCRNLKSVTMSDSVTSIGAEAFANCKSLTSVTIPDSLTTISNYLFLSCSALTDVIIPDGVTAIGDYAFCNCDSLTDITIPDNVISLGTGVFSDCIQLTDISISDRLKDIGSYAFWGCSSLTGITIPDSVTTIGDYAFYNCDGLTSITIPKKITNIGYYLFAKCDNLNSVTIPGAVTVIDQYAFNNCKGLSDVYYSGTEEEWGDVIINSHNDDLLEATIHFVPKPDTPSLSVESSDNEVTVSTDTLPYSGEIYFAVYDSSSLLVFAETKSVDAGDAITRFDLPENVSGKRAVIYIWKENSQIPLFDKYEFEL